MAEQKKSRKFDRNRKSGQNLAYKAEKRREKGHVRRIKQHLARYSCADKSARTALLSYAEQIGLRALQEAERFLSQRERAG